MLELLSQGWYILCGVLLLGILVAVHEFGHFMAARLTGIEVMEFAIGMGPKIFGWTGKKGTKFSLRCIPFGGFCAFYGEDDVEGKAKDDPRAYNKQAVWKRMLTVIMGPVMNFILAIVAAVIFCWAAGLTEVNPIIGSVEENGPAALSGMLPGDVVLAVNGEDAGVLVEDVGSSSIEDRLTVFHGSIANAQPGDALVFTVLRMVGDGDDRQEQILDLTIPTFLDEETGTVRIGIGYSIVAMSEERVHLGFLDGLRRGWNMCTEAATMVVDVLGKLFTDRAVRDNLTGPVGVVTQTSAMVEAGGVPTFINLLVVISVNLGLMNLLPFPGLDGARFVFHTVEAIRRKPLKPEIEGIINLVGTLLLLGLILLITFRDVWRLF